MYQEEIAAVMLTMIEPNTADQKPATKNPSSIQATSPNIAALTTNRNRPSVINVIGRVSNNAIGLINAFTSPSIIAAKIKPLVPLIETPGTSPDARNRPSIVINVRRIMPFISSYLGSQVED